MLSFSSPYWLSGLLVLPLLWWLHRFHGYDQAYRVAAIFIFGSGGDTGGQQRLARRAEPIWLLRALVVCLLVLSLAGPQWARRDAQSLTIWVDDSPSMFTQERGVSRIRRSLAELEQQLASSSFSPVTLRSLSAPETMQALSSPGKPIGSDLLRTWSTATQGEPQPPEAALMDSGEHHWLVSDGVSPDIAEWIRRAPVSRVIGVGAQGENVGVSALALRRSSGGGAGAQLLVTVINGGEQNVSRELVVSAGDQRLASLPLSLAARETWRNVIALDSTPTGILRATISPADALPLDDHLELSAVDVQGVLTHVSDGCGLHLAAALAAHPGLHIQEKPDASAKLNVYCGNHPPDPQGSALRIFGGEDFSPVRGDIYWHSSSGQLSELLLDASWLSAVPASGVQSTAEVLLGVTGSALILFNAKQNVVDVRLDMASPRLVERPEYPLLVAGLVDLLLGAESPHDDVAAVHYSSPVAIAPQPLSVSRPALSVPLKDAVRDLQVVFILGAILFVSFDLLLVCRRQLRQSRQLVAPVEHS